MLQARDYFDLDGTGLEELFRDLRYVWEALNRLETWLGQAPAASIEGEIMPGAWVGPDVSIGRGTIVEPGAYVQGPTVIGPDCHIRHGAYIRGQCLIGAGCIVGHATELKKVIMLPGASVPHLAYVGDSILGRRVNLGAGVKTANVKNDHSEVSVVVGGERIATGLRKFGAIIGDRTQIGCNCVSTPGTMIGPDCLVYPTVMLRGCYQRGRIIKGRGPVEVAERVPVGE
ncbi:MAG: hypothetical protein ACM3ZC_05460 [Bacteroidota bacterium]